MPAESLRSVMVIGSGPIVVGQACEFDYSGTQAIKALKREGLRVVLVNSNPATIMTDPDLADATYVEPVTAEFAEQIIQRERPDALLPTVGGQTALNLAVELAERGILEKYGVRLIGASLKAIRLAEDRQLFKDAMEAAGLPVARGDTVHSLDEARVLAECIGFPLLVRPSFTLGGTGGGIVHGWDDFEQVVGHGLRESPVHQALLEESVLGWKEFELEVMSDRAGSFVVVCSIENVDPMGVHTGDSITVAPALTLTDKEYQRLRDMARKVMAAVGVQTGGANVQFAVNPRDGRVLVIEMNPRVSRSSALASKATGFPIAKLAALVALGYTLDQLTNDITGQTVAAYEPSIDYVVTKVPRWGFEKFPRADVRLGPQMKSIGEVMAIGRTFQESLQKALRSLENNRDGLGRPDPRAPGADLPMSVPGPQRLFAAYAALLDGASIEQVAAETQYDPWFVAQFAEIAGLERELCAAARPLSRDLVRRAKRAGFSDHQIARLTGDDEDAVRLHRQGLGIRPVFAQVDTCAAEFAAQTPYLYSTYEDPVEMVPAPSGDGRPASDCGRMAGTGTAVPGPAGREIPMAADGVPPGPTAVAAPSIRPQSEASSRLVYVEDAPPSGRPTVVVLGSGPNRIGQGIEFDYCCCHAVQALHDAGYETIMVNCNPETVSTDYDTSDRLYFEPLTLEDVMAIVERERPVGVVLQFGGQTPLKLARDLERLAVPVLGTSPEAIDLAEDRARFGALLDRLGIPQAPHGFATNLEEARAVAREIGFPLLVRPSYVLGGRAMAIVYSESALDSFVSDAAAAAEGRAILIDRYLEDAYELDVDAVGDGNQIVIGGIMEHIEEAGVHSGDSACVLPPYKVSTYHLDLMRDYTVRLGLELGVKGLLNVQYAVKGDTVYVLEANPRASRTVPFVSKATGVPLARVAARVLAGKSLAEIGFTREPRVDGFFVKEAVLPFKKLPGADAVLGPEMRSTGEVMGHAATFGEAFYKSQSGAGDTLPMGGTALLSVNEFDKETIVKIGRDLADLGFRLVATKGTADALRRAGLRVEPVNKVREGSPHVVDLISSGQVDLVVNTPLGRMAFEEGITIRQAALRYRVVLLTTISAAAAAVQAIRERRAPAGAGSSLSVRSLQEHYERQRAATATNPPLFTRS